MPELWPVKIAFGDVDVVFHSRKFVSGPPVDGEYGDEEGKRGFN
jgi:hypothetical protein